MVNKYKKQRKASKKKHVKGTKIFLKKKKKKDEKKAQDRYKHLSEEERKEGSVSSRSNKKSF